MQLRFFLCAILSPFVFVLPKAVCVAVCCSHREWSPLIYDCKRLWRLAFLAVKWENFEVTVGTAIGLVCVSSRLPSDNERGADERPPERTFVYQRTVKLVVVAITFGSFAVWRYRSKKAYMLAGLLGISICSVLQAPEGHLKTPAFGASSVPWLFSSASLRFPRSAVEKSLIPGVLKPLVSCRSTAVPSDRTAHSNSAL